MTEAYLHRVQYYETDLMGVAHHSNYIRWMEEARIALMDSLGWPYRQMEAENIFSPVKAVSCEFRRPCTFGDVIRVGLRVEAFNGVVLRMGYDMRKADTGEQVCTGSSEHVFLDREGHFVRLKRRLPEFCAALEKLCGENAPEGGAPQER